MVKKYENIKVIGIDDRSRYMTYEQNNNIRKILSE